MSNLLVHPTKPDAQGRVQSITPQSAGWTYVGFEVYRLAKRKERDAARPAIARPASSCCRARRACSSGAFRLRDHRRTHFAVRGRYLVGLCSRDGCMDIGRGDAIAKLRCARRPARRQIAAARDHAEGGRAGTARRRHQHALCPQHPARRPSRAESLLVVEVITPRRPLVELSAAQARPRRAAGGVLSGRDLLSPPQSAAGLRPAARLYRRPLARRDDGGG